MKLLESLPHPNIVDKIIVGNTDEYLLFIGTQIEYAHHEYSEILSTVLLRYIIIPILAIL